jgi:uncharacterized membrane protein
VPQPGFHFDLIVAFASVALVAGYQLALRRTRADRDRLAIAFARRVRDAWIERVVQEGRDILAVQTLRNLLMAAHFFASTAFLAAVGLLSFGLTTAGTPALLYKLNFFGATDETAFTVKLLAIVVVFFASFFNFALAIRYYNHVVVAITSPPAAEVKLIERVQGLMTRGALHYAWGMRGFYYAIPLTLWFFGPEWMLAGSLLLVPLLHRHDHLPS